MKLFLEHELDCYRQTRDPFRAVFRLDGTVVRHVKNRRTLKTTINHKSYFIKIHYGTGWREILKNLLMLKKPVLGADNEYHAIRLLEKIGVPTTPVCGFGSRGLNPASKKSFIITRDLGRLHTVEDITREWRQKPPPFKLKLALIKKIAQISAMIHQHGLNHRDYYICHFLVAGTEASSRPPQPENLQLYLIDLHRAQIRKETPYRWMLKDIAGIWFSAMDAGLNKKDLLRFIRIYSGSPLRQSLPRMNAFLRKANNKAIKLYRKEHQRLPPPGP